MPIPITPEALPTITPTVSNSSYSLKTALTCSAASTVLSKVVFGGRLTETCTSVSLMDGRKLNPRSSTKAPLNSSAITASTAITLWRSTKRREDSYLTKMRLSRICFGRCTRRSIRPLIAGTSVSAVSKLAPRE